ncbi:MAG: DUF2585 family protein [Elusimicrobia bacterium]|nr:DUF2585 family protein [Elusimicrobiota bacterium]
MREAEVPVDSFGRKHAACVAAILVATAAVEAAMGRRLWGAQGRAGLWVGKVPSEHNSQYFADPYSFTHVLHGFAFFLGLHLAAPRLPLGWRAALAVALEAVWEIVENTDAVIERYRAATFSLQYYGDSIVNSTGDVLCCALGFYLASRLPVRRTVELFLATELLLLWAIGDNLLLNVIMLAYPLDWIKRWQMGG